MVKLNSSSILGVVFGYRHAPVLCSAAINHNYTAQFTAGVTKRTESGVIMYERVGEKTWLLYC